MYILKLLMHNGSTYKAAIPNGVEVKDGVPTEITGGQLSFQTLPQVVEVRVAIRHSQQRDCLQFEGNAWSSYQNMKLYAGLELYVNPDNTGFVTLTDLLNQNKAHLMRVEWFAYWMNRLHLYPYMHSWKKR